MVTTLAIPSSDHIPACLDELPVLLGDAVRNHHEILIHYRDVSQIITRRVIRPTNCYHLENHCYLDAYCHRAGANRTFRLDRVLRYAMIPPASAIQSIRRPPLPMRTESAQKSWSGNRMYCRNCGKRFCFAEHQHNCTVRCPSCGSLERVPGRSLCLTHYPDGMQEFLVGLEQIAFSLLSVLKKKGYSKPKPMTRQQLSTLVESNQILQTTDSIVTVMTQVTDTVNRGDVDPESVSSAVHNALHSIHSNLHLILIARTELLSARFEGQPQA